VTNFNPNALQTNPSAIVVGAKETLTVAVDTTNALSQYPGGTAPTAASVTCVQLPANITVTLGAPSIVGNVINTKVTAGTLLAGFAYQVTFTYVPSSTTDVIESVLQIVCPPYT
jgi:hypothetical protein